MADKKISELPAASVVNPTDEMPIVQAGATLRAAISLLPSGVGPSSDGQLLWNNAGSIDGTGRITYSPTGVILEITADDPADVPLQIQATGSQTGHLTEWQDSGSTAVTYVAADGHLSTDGISAGGAGAFLIAEDDTFLAGMDVQFAGGGFVLAATGGGSITLAPGLSGYTYLTNTIANVSVGLIGNGGLIVNAVSDVPCLVGIIGGAAAASHLDLYKGGSLVFGIGNGGTIKTNQTASGSTLGTVVGSLPIYDASGSLVGYVPIYDSIT